MKWGAQTKSQCRRVEVSSRRENPVVSSVTKSSTMKTEEVIGGLSEITFNGFQGTEWSKLTRDHKCILLFEVEVKSFQINGI